MTPGASRRSSAGRALWRLAVLALLALFLIAVDSLPAQTEGPPASSPSAEAEDSAERDEASPFTVPEPSPEAVRYYRSGNLLWLVNVAWALAVPALFLVLGWAAGLRGLAGRWTGRWLPTVLLVFVGYSVAAYLLDFPLSLYGGFVRPHAYDLSNQSFGMWLGDSLKALGVSIAFGVPIFGVLYTLLRKSPRRWWLWTGLLTLPFLAFTVLVGPIWIAPLFDDFGPMRDKELEAEILELADRVGVEAERVFEVNKSEDTSRVNAYVTGIAGTHRIVLWDTLLAELDDAEVLVVMAHELGHYVLGHVWTGILLGWLGSMLALFLVDRLGRWTLARWGGRWRVSSLADPASLPLILLLLTTLTLAGSPVALAFSRHQERAADRFARELTHDPEACAGAFRKLLVKNLSYPWPGPVYEALRASHPPIGERIEGCGGS